MLTTIVIILAVLGLVLILAYPWISVAALLLVPVFKVAASYYVPVFRTVDLTLAACAVAGVMAVWTYLRRSEHRADLSVPWAALICMSVIALDFAMGLLWTSAPDYGLRKVVRFTGIAIPYLLLPTFFVRTKKDGHRMILMVVLVGLLVATWLTVAPRSVLSEIQYSRGYSRGTVLGSGSNIPAAITAVGMLTLLTTFVVAGSATRLLRYLALIALPLGLLAILITGSRSNMLALILAATALPFLSGRSGRGKGMFIIFGAMPAMIILAFTLSMTSEMFTVDRWFDFASSLTTLEATGSRSSLWMFCLQNWWERPLLGHGPGSFAMDLFHVDVPMWPHNIMFEALYEAGLVGATALTLFFFFTLREGRRGLRRAVSPQDRLLVAAPFMMVIFMIIPAMTHWDIEGVRFLYLFAGLLHANVGQLDRAPTREGLGVAAYPSHGNQSAYS